MSGETGDALEDARERVGSMSRRDWLKAVAGGTGVVGAAKAIDNVVIGYGVLVGTNLVAQDLGPLATEGLQTDPETFPLDGRRAELTVDPVRLRLPDADASTALEDPETAADFDAAHDLPGVARQLARDLPAIESGDVSFSFSQYPAFFDRLREGETRPFTVGAVRGRGYTDVPSRVVGEFADVDPAAPEALVEGLADAFRQHTDYDIPRYVAGSVEDNVLFGHVELRAHFREPVHYEAIRDATDAGLFCYEFTWRSIEALHSVPPHRQTVPVFGAKVIDQRHKHVYTAIGSVLRTDGGLEIPMTFVDYTHSTLYDDLYLRGIMGDGLKAYNTRHRATGIYYDAWGGEPL